MFANIFQRVSASPTNPQAQPPAREFDIADLYRGPAATAVETAAQTPLDEKLRQACFWIVNHAIISPFYDIEYNEANQPAQTFTLGTATAR
jgi:MoxR-like ATPase